MTDSLGDPVFRCSLHPSGVTAAGSGTTGLVLAALRGLLARQQTTVVSQLSRRMGSATVLAGIPEVRVGRESSAPLVVGTVGCIAQGLVGGGIDFGHDEGVPGDPTLYTAPDTGDGECGHGQAEPFPEEKAAERTPETTEVSTTTTAPPSPTTTVGTSAGSVGTAPGAVTPTPSTASPASTQVPTTLAPTTTEAPTTTTTRRATTTTTAAAAG